ncbi:adenosylcobinamide-GDP ribazoletransferase [Salipaludibacillus neizhouensis]|uniref:Adenosylcobinamide-GDP ribazoletransferase n=1 Tax=Salipaludibacillus neizhouensis TaxID=885475 RepID=A0A3A9K4E2_9BACI|nr:adenosylcobinamide-GDP ribazoletransferase [Salipaludibacillus neizhouensis]RKL66198.1 adenosylcobinamide-GDP ribazoletransferase [Salipaludibacillus neizhouensis]
MKNSMYGFLLAVQFLTRLPVPVTCPWNEKTSRWAIRFYPLVGMIVGFILAGGWVLLKDVIPSEILALCIISLWVWLTGGLHLDGLMDVADAVGSNAPLKKKWEIMKDPHVGSFGIIALLFVLAWKVVLVFELQLAEINDITIILVMLGIIGFARFHAVLLLGVFPSAKTSGLAWEWKKNLTIFDIFFSFLPLVILCVFAPNVIFLGLAYGLFILVYGVWMMKTFKGTNGDLIGTAIEGGELWGLLSVWIFFLYGMG